MSNATFIRLLLGLALLATLTGCGGGNSAPSISGLEVVRLSGSDDYGRGPFVYICSGETLTLKWGTFYPSYILDITPSYAASPPVNNQQFTEQRELNVTLVDAATITLSASEGKVDERDLTLIPSYLCDDFPLPLVGKFTGILTQTEPTAQTLERRLSLEWKGNSRKPWLEAELLEAGEQFGLELECNPDVALQTLSCTNLFFELTATLTSEGLTGNYEGVARDSVSSSTFSGTFDFSAP